MPAVLGAFGGTQRSDNIQASIEEIHIIFVLCISNIYLSSFISFHVNKAQQQPLLQDMSLSASDVFWSARGTTVGQRILSCCSKPLLF